MSLPSADADYAAPPDMRLGRAEWDAAMTSIGQRLRAMEALAIDYQAAVDQLTAQALAVITDSISAEITAQRAGLDALAADMQAVADAYADLVAGNVQAADVAVSEIAGLAAANVQAALAGLRAQIVALGAALDALDRRAIRYVDLTVSQPLTAGVAYRMRLSGLSLTLPGAPATGDAIKIIDSGVITPTTPSTLLRSGKTIMGLAEDLTINVAGLDFEVWYDGTTWRLL